MSNSAAIWRTVAEKDMQSETSRPPDLITEQNLAKRWSRSPRSLQRWRAAGKVPRYMRIGCSIYYQLDDIRTFEAAHVVKVTTMDSDRDETPAHATGSANIAATKHKGGSHDR